ncbi:MAG: DinB family protein [Gemmatimonadetes bacterium]|nr:DinB family protein [Gemmatimonadota bacterium]
MAGSIASALIPEIQMEGANTRKVLERLPVAKREWAPHAKSSNLGKLASHVAQLAGWAGVTATTTELDLAMPYPVPTWTTSAELVKIHDENVAMTVAALEKASDADLMGPWTLRMGPQVLFTMPRVQVIRGMCINHLVHHRGQLTVYLRLNDVPLPNLYGPTADER